MAEEKRRALSLPSVHLPSLSRFQEVNLFEIQQILIEHLAAFPAPGSGPAPRRCVGGGTELRFHSELETEQSPLQSPLQQAAKWLIGKSENPKGS